MLRPPHVGGRDRAHLRTKPYAQHSSVFLTKYFKYIWYRKASRLAKHMNTLNNFRLFLCTPIYLYETLSTIYLIPYALQHIIFPLTWFKPSIDVTTIYVWDYPVYTTMCRHTYHRWPHQLKSTYSSPRLPFLHSCRAT